MFSAIRSSALPRASIRAFSTSSARRADLAKLTLIGRLGADPETRSSKNDRSFVTYTVATSNPGVPDPETGEYAPTKPTWHRVFSFSEASNRYLMTLKKGSRVYVETAFELKEPEAGADPTTPHGQRQIFLRHESIKVISPPKPSSTESEHFE
ncbi:hypothetical protein CPB85DRAFT_1386291 [Mucidula mucida]|nr:hypothetical protein CPB85DRAFT_1386291 [Mucidula mucida]